MPNTHKIRRTVLTLLVAIGFSLTLLFHPDLQQSITPVIEVAPAVISDNPTGGAADALEELAVKGRAPKTNYSRSQFGSGWVSNNGCDTRNIILHRDLTEIVVGDKCKVMSGTLYDPYTGLEINFIRGETSSQAVQIDHVVALSNAWQTGAQQLSADKRVQLANDPLELLAVDGPANMQKSDGDAATWLPSNKAFRCQYVARQIAVKAKYDLWATSSEKQTIAKILTECPGQSLP